MSTTQGITYSFFKTTINLRYLEYKLQDLAISQPVKHITYANNIIAITFDNAITSQEEIALEEFINTYTEQDLCRTEKKLHVLSAHAVYSSSINYDTIAKYVYDGQLFLKKIEEVSILSKMVDINPADSNEKSYTIELYDTTHSNLLGNITLSNEEDRVTCFALSNIPYTQSILELRGKNTNDNTTFNVYSMHHVYGT